jgi:quinol monooxygenase YgiN
MTVEYIRYTIDASRQAAFVEAYQKAADFLDQSNFCLGYELTHCEEEKEQFILRIEWTSTDDHLNGFRKSAEFRAFLGHIRPFFNDIEEMNHYALTSVVKKKQ